MIPARLLLWSGHASSGAIGTHAAAMDNETPQGNTVGDRLRAAREARALTLDEVANETRIPIRHLRNIEDSNWDELPAVTYTIGFARAYANAVGLDGAAIGQEVRNEAGGTYRAPTVSPEVYAPPDPSRVPSRPLAWIAFILLIVLIAAWLLVIRPWLTREDDVPAPAPTAEEAAPQPAAPAQPATPQSAAGQPVVLVATAPVWISVSDRAGGNRVLRTATLNANDRYEVPADAREPFVRTTNPQNLRVSIGGQDRGTLGTRYGSVTVSLKAEDLAAQLSQQPAAGAPAR